MHPHVPPVYRAVGTCQTCHTQENYRLHEGGSYQSIPGHPRWDMAPLSMASPIYNRWIMPSMIARAVQKGDTIDRAIGWAEQELQGLQR